MTDLLIPFGQRVKDQRAVHVDDMPSGKACGCICPACQGTLVARKGPVRVHHFAHSATNGDCTGESWLHSTAKMLLFQGIEDALLGKRDIPLSWQCGICPKECEHTGNLLKRAVYAHMEKAIPGANIRPDIHLTNGDGDVIVLLEVDHTNLQQSVIDYVKANEIPLLVFHIKTVDDLDRLEVSSLTPQVTTVPFCPCPPCHVCKERLCDSQKHSHCRNCNKKYDPNYGLNDGHYFCDKCQRCVDAPSDFNVFHWHCRDCGKACEERTARYIRCFCCYNANKFGLEQCTFSNSEHKHCKNCGRVFNDNGIYEICYPCQKELELKRSEKTIPSGGDINRLPPSDGEWQQLNEWYLERKINP